jgi:hypothetical protein
MISTQKKMLQYVTIRLKLKIGLLILGKNLRPVMGPALEGVEARKDVNLNLHWL